MKKLTIFFAILISRFWLVVPIINAEEITGDSALLKNEVFGFEKSDSRIEILSKFFEFYDSPLVDYADDFVKIADEFQIDWRLVPAITGVESTFGKKIPYNSYNAYGWNNGVYNFESWEDSIEHVMKTLKEKYVNRGLDTPAKIAPVYAPPSNTWAYKVAFFMEKIANFVPQTPTLTI